MMRTITALPALVLLAGCMASQDTSTAPPPDEQPFFVGRWAASEDLCTGGAWVFTPTSLVTAGEVSCSFNAVTQTPTGYTIDAVCTAEGPPAPAQIQVSFAESAQALLVEGGPFSPVGLIACPG